MEYLKYINFIKNKTVQKYVIGGTVVFSVLGGIGYLVKNDILHSFTKKNEKIEAVEAVETVETVEAVEAVEAVKVVETVETVETVEAVEAVETYNEEFFEIDV